MHNLLRTIGIFFDGADIINGFVYLAEKDYVNAAISFACGIPAVGTVVTAVAKTAKLAKYATKAAKIAKTCRDIGRIGNAAAGMKALYDTYQTAERECETTGEKIAYIAGTVITGYLVGKVANKGAEALKKFASKAIPKLKTALKESAGKLIGKVNKKFASINLSSGNKSWYKSNGRLNFPPNDGAVPGSEKMITLEIGDAFGRYGQIGEKSTFVTQTGTDYSKLALPPNTDPAIYTEFIVRKPISETMSATIAPWGESEGGGIQYNLPHTIKWLKKEGYIMER